MAAADPAAVTAETPRTALLWAVPEKDAASPVSFAMGKDAMEKALSARDSRIPRKESKDFLFRLTEGASISNKIPTHERTANAPQWDLLKSAAFFLCPGRTLKRLRYP